MKAFPGSASDPMLQRWPFQNSTAIEGCPSLLADFMDRADVVQGGCSRVPLGGSVRDIAGLGLGPPKKLQGDEVPRSVSSAL